MPPNPPPSDELALEAFERGRALTQEVLEAFGMSLVATLVLTDVDASEAVLLRRMADKCSAASMFVDSLSPVTPSETE